MKKLIVFMFSVVFLGNCSKEDENIFYSECEIINGPVDSLSNWYISVYFDTNQINTPRNYVSGISSAGNALCRTPNILINNNEFLVVEFPSSLYVTSSTAFNWELELRSYLNNDLIQTDNFSVVIPGGQWFVNGQNYSANSLWNYFNGLPILIQIP